MTTAGRRLGKVDREFLSRVLLANTGAKSESVVVGPGVGLDNAVLSVGDGRVMIVTADPLSMIPSVGMERSAWLTVHELASDFATSGVRPQFAVLDLNLPPSLDEVRLARYVRALSDECKKLGVAIVGGHTGRYPGSDYSIVGGGVMMGLAAEDEYLTPAMMRDGDAILMTKGAAIEATSVLAMTFPRTVEGAIGAKMAARARGYFELCSTVADARSAVAVGIKDDGVTSMHDATEGGVLGALFELARASGRLLSAERGRIHVSGESSGVCSAFGLDPLTTLSEGTLVLTCVRRREQDILQALARSGIEAFSIGEVGKKDADGGRLMLSTPRGKMVEYRPPRFDRYWTAYANGLENGWK